MMRVLRQLKIADLPQFSERVSLMSFSQLRLHRAARLASRDFRTAAIITRKYHPGSEHVAKSFENVAGRIELQEIRTLQDAAEADDGEAQFDLGRAYQDGWVVSEDEVQAVKWWLRAAEKGRWRASSLSEFGLGAVQYAIGEAYREGRGVRQDDAEAIAWWLKAMEQGDHRALTELCNCIFLNEGGPFRLTPAEHRAAAAKIRRDRPQREDLAKAHVVMWRLGFDGSHTLTGEQSNRLSSEHFRAAGLIIRESHPTKPYLATACDCVANQIERAQIDDLHRAAAKGDVNAQYELGEVYYEGWRVPRRDHAQAVKWWLRAADQGCSAAQYKLGCAFGQGDGVPQDYVMAHMWFSLSWEEPSVGPDIFFNPAADEQREYLEHLMTPVQITEAQERARAFLD
jgi:TPR repeat protein